MSKMFRDVELKYVIMEKQAYGMVKSLKHFKTYTGYNRVTCYVPHPAMKDILSQQDCLGTKGKWVVNTKYNRYDAKIKPIKLITGKGLARLMAIGNKEALGLKEESCALVYAVNDELERQDWYRDIIYYLKNFSAP